MSPAESFVQVAADGPGKKIRNLSLTDPQGPDTSGNAQADLVRYQQVVTLANKLGDSIDGWDEMVGELRSINETLHLILAALS